MRGRIGRVALRVVTGLVLAFIYIPLALVVVYAFNESGTSAWPPSGFTLAWVGEAAANSGLQQAFLTSLAAALGATLIALVLGSLASLAVARYSFFGREAISFVVILPIALPGIVTGMALSTTFASIGLSLGLITILDRPRDVLRGPRLQQRDRPPAPDGQIARRKPRPDLGADTFQTFRYVTFPALRSALLAGALLAFALSFDEVIVTIFTAGGVKTLPIWIFQSFRLANQVPLVNVAGLAAIL